MHALKRTKLRTFRAIALGDDPLSNILIQIRAWETLMLSLFNQAILLLLQNPKETEVFIPKVVFIHSFSTKNDPNCSVTSFSGQLRGEYDCWLP